MNWLTIASLPASIMDWTLANIPGIGILIFICWSIWKFISWLDGKFSVIDKRFGEIEMTMALGFVKVDAELKIINHRLDDHDKRIEALETKTTRLEVKIDQLETRIERIEIQIERIETKIDALVFFVHANKNSITNP